jgi:membrane protein implicated in regulation of membrane protease activity
MVMRCTVMFLVLFVTIFLLVLTVLAFTNISFSWMFGLTVIGQLLVVVMVYKVLRDHYTTDKTFEDFYEDYPIGRE